MIPRTLAVALAALLPIAASAASVTAHASLQDAAGKEVGKATFTQVKGGVRVKVRVSGLPEGQHGIHIHEVGQCDPPDFKSAGGHLNPAGKQHGLHNPQGAHAGDLPNLTVGKGGRGRATFTASGARLEQGEGSLLAGKGTALVIHAGADDERSDPAGNSGARIACGVIRSR